MIDQSIVESIFRIKDLEQGGDNALNGFEFQQSAAIYLMFLEIRNQNKAQLLYEKIEDFIIISSSIKLYQAKSLSKSLTPTILTNKVKGNHSIIEKMHNNYSLIKEKIKNIPITTTLVICENQKFSTKLKLTSCNYETKEINFDDLKNEVKNEIIEKTNLASYDWKNINALKIIPKPRHEEVTRAFIADVVTELIGDNKINSKALYDSLSGEIKRIRKFKETLSTERITKTIIKFSNPEEEIQFKDVVCFLSRHDEKNLQIMSYFNILKVAIKVINSDDYHKYNQLKEYLKNNKIITLDDFYNEIENNKKFEQLFILRDEEEIKALLLLVIGKEGM